ncbi:hypothetical protein M2189_004842 [Bradyrhizobium japonicum]|uniref:hypothetical protein n=1 Tax=Bradyrhizobium japonicum TaxID=375 RepID=UPI002168A933|nr:hypothetical protein [Bradyrhizobium japonicum]MCS3496198.1 hypothetical protein [Bradyrhizobium japonicum]MCS3961639.1 hypothetical protein [Bradyrhizobium japonicum]MCS3993955.1 hypothetical protein [Bradyrhizobium japonicum]
MVRQRDLKAAIEQARKAGLTIRAIKFDAGGGVVMQFGDGPDTAPLDDEVAAWDEAIRKNRGTGR